MPLIPPVDDPYGRNRIWFRMPRWIPDSLDSLHGPDQGTVNLPVTIDWGPGHERLDLSDAADVRRIYSALIANADDATQERLMNKRLLIREWPFLSVEKWRVRPAWEQAFPILKERRLQDGIR